MNAADVPLWRRLCYTRLSDAVRWRWNAGLDWRTVIAAADLPPEVAGLIRCVVSRTRLLRSEKVDVARELIAHFQDGIDAGRTPRELTEPFGDPRQAAQLIRRAKRRGRPLVWHLWHYSLWTVFVLLLLYALAAIYLLHARPVPNVDYLPGLNGDAHSVTPDERAWPLYRDALLATGYHQDQARDGEEYRPFGVNHEARPGDADWPELHKFLADHQRGLAELRQAAAKPHLGYEIGFEIHPEDHELLGESRAPETPAGEPHPSLMNMLLPHLSAVRDAATLLARDAYRAVEDDDASAAHADIVAVLNMSRQLGESPFLVGGNVALSVETTACDAIEHVMTVKPEFWTDEQLAELAHRLGGRRFNVATWLESERILMFDMIQRLYTDDGHGNGTITYSGLRDLIELVNVLSGPDAQRERTQRDRLLAAGMPILAGVMASRAELEEEHDKLFAMAVTDFQTPLWKKHPTMDDEARLIGRSQWLRVKYMPILLMLPSMGAFRPLVERADGRAEGVMIGLALQLYHREYGRWPASLDELAPRWLPAVPVDRINGGPLGYRIVDDRPLVYSLGNDTDDDGRPLASAKRHEYEPRGPDPKAEDGDWVIWSTVPPEAAPTWEDEEYGSGGSSPAG